MLLTLFKTSKINIKQALNRELVFKKGAQSH